MLKHYITYYPDTDKLKTFKQTWKGRDEIYEEYHINGNISLYKEWDGDKWFKHLFNEKGDMIYYQDNRGYYQKWSLDENGEEIYYETSDGYWCKREYDKNGKCIYYEDSNGKIINHRIKLC